MLKYKDELDLSEAVKGLCNEVMRLNQAVNRLERHAAGQVIKFRDLSLTFAGVLVSISSFIWCFKLLF